MFTDIFISAVLAALIIFLLFVIKKVMLMPVALGKETELTVIVRVRGSEPRLEQTIGGLKWLVDSGALRAEIIISDLGMDEATLALAKRAVRDRAYLKLDEDKKEWEKGPNTSK